MSWKIIFLDFEFFLESNKIKNSQRLLLNILKIQSFKAMAGRFLNKVAIITGSSEG